MELLCLDLRGNGNQKDGGEDEGTDQVAKVHGHGDRIAADFAESGAEDLDDPKKERDLGNLVELDRAVVLRVGLHSSPPKKYSDQSYRDTGAGRLKPAKLAINPGESDT